MSTRQRLGASALGLCLLALLYLRSGDPFGDRGMSNVFAMLLLAALGLGLILALAFHPGIALRLRLGGLAVLAVALLASSRLVRFEGVSGEMIPHLGWRAGARRAPEPEVAAGAGVIALSPPASSDFPGFLGGRRDNAAPEARLARDWSARAPRALWRGPIGAGWSAFAVAGGWAFTLEQDAHGQRASARSAATGALGWSVPLDAPFEHALGGPGPRATPTVELEPGGGRVYALSAWGLLACLDAEDGERLWSHDLMAEHGLTREREQELAQYGRSSSPLLHGELVIVPAGGEPGAGAAGLVAFDKRTGERRWASPPRNYSYSSPAVATLAGVQQVLIVNEASLSGHAPDDGRILWEHPWPGTTSGDANVSQAVPLAPERVFVSKGYGGGGALLALEPGTGGGLRVRELWHDGRILRTKLTNVVMHAGHVYALDDGMLECVELATGRKRWKEGRYGHGQILLAGELLLVCSEEGEVLLVEPTPERANAVLGRFQALAGKCWAHLALAGRVLFLRNGEECAAWELPAES
jgi:outer membrane protein assembly factor BamB